MFMSAMALGQKSNAETSSRALLVSDDDIDSSLHNPRYLQYQLKCALGKGPCDTAGKRLKSKLIILIL